MKIFNITKLLIHFILNFVTNFCHISKNYIYRIEQKLQIYKRINTIMNEPNERAPQEQNQQQAGADEAAALAAAPPARPLNEMPEPARQLEQEGDLQLEPMDLMNFDGPDDDEMYSSSEEVDWTSSNTSDSETSFISMWPLRSLQGLTNCTTYRPKPIYTFQPYKLIKRNFKHRNALTGFPLARSGHRVISSESNLYSLGGYNPRTANSARRRGRCLLFQELWAYNFATNTWNVVLDARNSTNMPTELASNALTLYKNVIISHGGTGFPFGESCSNDCYMYTTGSKPFAKKLDVTGDLPVAQYGPGIVIHDDYLYTIGGTTGFDYSCDIFRLDLKTRVWESVYICRPEMREDPEGRYRHEVVYDGTHIFLLGGGTSQLVYDLERIPAYNLKTNKWEYFDTLPDERLAVASNAHIGFPKPRKCFACVQHTSSNGDVEAFISGGLQGDSRTYFSDIWKLNMRTKQWYWIQNAYLPKPLYFHSAAHTGTGCMYIFGGIEYSDKNVRRRNDLFKMWMTIPKLTEMCWDAITYYNEDLDCYDRNTLLKAGIPQRFLERVPQRLRKKPRSHLMETRLDSCFNLGPKRQRSLTQ